MRVRPVNSVMQNSCNYFIRVNNYCILPVAVVVVAYPASVGGAVAVAMVAEDPPLVRGASAASDP